MIQIWFGFEGRDPLVFLEGRDVTRDCTRVEILPGNLARLRLLERPLRLAGGEVATRSVTADYEVVVRDGAGPRCKRCGGQAPGGNFPLCDPCGAFLVANLRPVNGVPA